MRAAADLPEVCSINPAGERTFTAGCLFIFSCNQLQKDSGGCFSTNTA